MDQVKTLVTGLITGPSQIRNALARSGPLAASEQASHLSFRCLIALIVGSVVGIAAIILLSSAGLLRDLTAVALVSLLAITLLLGSLSSVAGVLLAIASFFKKSAKAESPIAWLLVNIVFSIVFVPTLIVEGILVMIRLESVFGAPNNSMGPLRFAPGIFDRSRPARSLALARY